MGHLKNGVWSTEWYQPDSEGRFQRPPTVFRNHVSTDGSTPHAVEAGRYHLYVSLACPWAHRILIARALKGLNDITVSVVDPFMSDDGWHFDADTPGATQDHLFGEKYLRDVYLRADSTYTGRVTVPVLWDKKLNTIVNNESRDILRIFDHDFDSIATNKVDLAPAELMDDIESAITAIYEPINNGVYRAGFSGSQSAYEEAVNDVFTALDHWESVLSTQRYMCGSVMSEADICLFTTLVRFDPVYVLHFRCNLKMLHEYPNLWAFTRDMYQTPGIAETVNFTHIKRHYFESHDTINPKRLVPLGPNLDYDAPHHRERRFQA